MFSYLNDVPKRLVFLLFKLITYKYLKLFLEINFFYYFCVMNKKYIYLDDVRTPIDMKWIVVRNYDEFVSMVNEIGLENIELISLDHDLGVTAMEEYYNNTRLNMTLNYDNIVEKTGLDCARWLVDQWMDGKPYVKVLTHSANPVGSMNIVHYINSYCSMNSLPQETERVRIPHSVDDKIY